MVVDGRPLDGATEVALDAHHQLADVAREVEIARVFRGHDEPELVPLTQARLLEGLAGRGRLGAVEHARRAVLLDAVALDVPQVPGGRLGAVPSELLHVRFDDDAARVVPRTEASGGRELRRRPGAEAPVTTAHERRDAKWARGHPIASRDRSDRSEVESRPVDRPTYPACPSPSPISSRPPSARTRREGPHGSRYPPTPKEPKIPCYLHGVIQIRGLPFILPFAFAPVSTPHVNSESVLSEVPLLVPSRCSSTFP